MQKSETIGKLSKALTLVQGELKPASKDSDNPFFKSKYADLNSVWDACREPLAKNGLSVIQGNSVGIDNTVIVETILAHESGEWIQSELCLPLAKHDPQGVGSAVTYGRRYGLAAIVGIVADIDDDGNAASNNGAKAAKQFNDTKEQIKNAAQPTEREGLLTGLKTIGKALNDSGDSIEWKPSSTNEFIGSMFGESVTLSNISVEQLRSLTADLQHRLKTLRGGK